MGYLLEGLEFDSDDERIKAIFNYKHFGIPAGESARKAHFLENDFAFLSQALIRNIYEVAVKIMSQTLPGDTLVIFGNTPYFVGRALHHLISNDPESSNDRTIIEFPFTGSPGRFRGGNNFPKLQDILTRERLAHFRERLRSVGLSSDNPQLSTHATYFIDVVCSGAGIAFTAEQILRDFQSKGMESPHLNVISIRKINIHDEEDPRNATIAQENPDQNGHTKLYFPHLGECHFSMDCYQIYLPGHEALDFLQSSDHRAFPVYHAFYWQKQYDFLLTRKKPHFEIVKEYFDTNIKHLLETEKT